MTHESNKQHTPPLLSEREYEAKIAKLEKKIVSLEETIKALVAQLDRATDF
jgi:multidrug resistance efflux pump